MAYRSFAHFLDELDRMSELVRIAEPVATELEITELADRQMKAAGGGKALLFEKPTIDGRVSEFPVAINTMGSYRRMARAIGLNSIDEIAHQMQLILKAKPPTSFREGWSLLRQGIDLLHARPNRVTDGPCKEVIHRFDTGSSFSLKDLPILLCWPKDGGRFITFPTVYTKDPDTG
ncbi:MAG TPA: UbiD family decarboxylase domain-containing protein, partial [Chthoniobacterales bacterium]|nr:UbiD family decarboxylase domain-containing protein [Chthoniobacterales bacterium]